ncbi:MAG: hypothetical protein P9L92_13695 [Candidatus Electryonea clarkiae]|nr:hypothetical protein [Candidatus Electryonea clarkiae]
MKFHLSIPRLLIVTILLVSCVLASYGQTTSENSSSLRLKHLTLAFWNDTADAERFVEEGWVYAPDDYITTSIAANISVDYNNKPWIFAWNTNVITLKDEGYRTDLLTIRLSKPITWEKGQFVISAGIMGNGNFGGESIQNGYHFIRSHRIIDLPYPESRRIGPMFEEQAVFNIWETNSNSFYLCLKNFNALPAGYHRYRGMFLASSQISPAITCEATFGYSGFYLLHDSLQPVFQNGIEYGILFRWELRERVTISAWAYANAYRNDQSIPGISLTFGSIDNSDLLTGMALFP